MKVITLLFAIICVALSRSLTSHDDSHHNYLFYPTTTYYPSWGTRSLFYKHNAQEDKNHDEKADDKSHKWTSWTTTRTWRPIWKHNDADKADDKSHKWVSWTTTRTWTPIWKHNEEKEE